MYFNYKNINEFSSDLWISEVHYQRMRNAKHGVSARPNWGIDTVKFQLRSMCIPSRVKYSLGRRVVERFCKMLSESSHCTAAAVQLNVLWNSEKTFYKTFFTTWHPWLYIVQQISGFPNLGRQVHGQNNYHPAHTEPGSVAPSDVCKIKLLTYLHARMSLLHFPHSWHLSINSLWGRTRSIARTRSRRQRWTRGWRLNATAALPSSSPCPSARTRGSTGARCPAAWSPNLSSPETPFKISVKSHGLLYRILAYCLRDDWLMTYQINRVRAYVFEESTPFPKTSSS